MFSVNEQFINEMKEDSDYGSDVDEREEMAKVILEGECSELGVALDLLITKYLPAYFDKDLIEKSLQAFSKQLKSEAKCLAAWKIIFQQLSMISLFLHTLVKTPLPKFLKNSDEFNSIRNIALQTITVRAELRFCERENAHDLDFLHSNENFYEMQVVTSFIDTAKLAEAMTETFGPETDKNTVRPLDRKALTLFINKICGTMRMVRYALEKINEQLIYANTSTLQDHLPIVKQSFYFYNEAIIDTQFEHFLKIDLFEAKKNAFVNATDAEVYSDEAAIQYYKELMLCELFAFEGLSVVLPDFVERHGAPYIAPQYLNELKVKIENEEQFRDLIREFDINVQSDNNTQLLAIYLHLDFAALFIKVEQIKKLDIAELAHSKASIIFWGLKYNIDCLAFIIDCLRKKIEIYQHVEHDVEFQALAEIKHSKQKPASRKNVEEKKIFGTVMKEQIENLQSKINFNRLKKQEFYDIYNLAVANKAVKSQSKRVTKLVSLKNAIVNDVMLELDRISEKLDALKLKFLNEDSTKEFSHYETKIQELNILADKTIADILYSCRCWNIATDRTPPPAPAPLRRRHSDNAGKKKEKKLSRITTPSISSFKPAEMDSLNLLLPPLDSNPIPPVELKSETSIEITAKPDAEIDDDISEIFSRIDELRASDALRTDDDKNDGEETDMQPFISESESLQQFKWDSYSDAVTSEAPRTINRAIGLFSPRPAQTISLVSWAEQQGNQFKLF
jgi:hypothetical protein